jgi:nucleotide-binding universal stress UspA family protein
VKALVAYDGSLNAKKALRYWARKVKERGGEILLLNVFNSALFIDYGAGPGAEQRARAELLRYVEEARSELREAGVSHRVIFREGSLPEEIAQLAAAEKADIIFAPPGCRTIMKSAPCPVSFIPGHILVPLDKTDISEKVLERIREEVKDTGSKVILLGIVPVHIYGKSEKRELEKVKHETSFLLKRTVRLLNENRIEAKEILRSGYPDEEIAKIAADYPLSMIIMPAEGEEPSELSKAAAILSDSDSWITTRPLILSHASV